MFSVGGNLIREVVTGRRLHAGINVVQWDGRDRNERIVSDGIYTVMIQGGGRSANKTVGVLNR